jgi:dihydrolipoamide dehydrogenase
VDGQRIQCEHLLLATGSNSVELPMLPIGPIISSTEALAPKALPQHLVVVGGGYIGLELGIAYRKLGARSAWWKRASASCRPTTPS